MDNGAMSQAKLLRQLREERGSSQEAVAKGLGVSRPTYISLEQGKRELTLSEAEKVSRMYDIPLDAIVLGKKPAEVSLVQSSRRAKGEKDAEVRVSIPQER